MILRYLRIFLCAMLWLFSVTAFSQYKIPIKKAFAQIQKQHKVTFNYTEGTLRDFEVAKPSKSQTLLQQLDAIRDQTPLGFEILGGRYIIVKTNNEAASENLNAEAFKLNEVTIDHLLTSGISRLKFGDFEIKPKEFGLLPGLTEPDVLQTMQQIPGVYSTDESISNINVRGGTNDQNLFLWNGIRMFQTGHFFGLISAFNPVLTEKITITKNGSPSYYSESVSSTVALSTHLDSLNTSQFGAGINLLSADVFAKVKLSPKAALVVSGRRSYTDLTDTPTYHSYYNRIFQNTIVTQVDNNEAIDYHTSENFYFYDASVQYQQKIGQKHQLFIDAITISNQLGIDQNAIVNGVYNSKYSSLAQQSLGGQLLWETVWNKRNTSKINGYVSGYTLDAVNQSIENNQTLVQQNRVLDMGLRIENHHQLNRFWSFNNGYQYNETGITNFDEINAPILRRKIKEVLHTHALILETEYLSQDRKAAFKGGIRANYFEQIKQFLIEPRVSFGYSFNAAWKLELLGEQKSQTASQVVDLQRDFLGIEKRRWTLSGGDIPVQKSNQLSVGLTFKKRSWLFTLDNFYKEVTGISSPSQAFQNQLELVRINGDYSVAGSEFLIQKRFNKFYAWASYTFNRNDYHFDSYAPNDFPNNFEIAHSLTASLIYESKGFKAGLGCKWKSGRPTTTPKSYSEYTITYNDPNNQYLDSYVQCNASASYKWQYGKAAQLQLSASVLNLLGRENIINRYYRVNTLANQGEQINTRAMERTPNLSLRLMF